MKETMTVHKGLAELKILGDRIGEAIREASFVVANKHSNTKISGESISDYSAAAKTAYQSITSLINRRNAIKRSITRSNAETKVTIAGVEYTVAEAIDMKSTGMSFTKTLADTIASQLKAAKVAADRNNGERLDDRADEYVRSMYSGSDMKNMADELKKVREDFVTAQTVEIVDPINAAEKVDMMTKKYDAFMAEVDSALSVSNALTTIEVEYETV